MPVGLGEPIFDRLEADVAHSMMSLEKKAFFLPCIDALSCGYLVIYLQEHLAWMTSRLYFAHALRQCWQ
jgi:hypothetical protein